jgi:tripartite-type tricarboxylate transporter receptor subunit TctC
MAAGHEPAAAGKPGNVVASSAEGSMSINISTIRAVLGLLLILSTIAASPAQQAGAQTYPSGPIHIIVPFAAGGLVDALARITGARITESMGQPVIVENRPGASSTIGMQACANAKPDGHTVCPTTADSLSYNPQLFANLPYDPEKSFSPIIRLALTNNLLVANARAPFNTYKEMIAYAKANPAKLNWGTWGPATLPDLYLRWISSQAGVHIQAIPYKGGAAQANPAVYSGEVDITYMGFGVAAPQIAAGTVKPLVALGAKRSPFMPELPSLGEEGGDPGLQGYFGLWAPAGTPKPIIQRLNAEFAKAIATPQVQAFYKASTLLAEPNTPEEFGAFAKADREAAAKVFKSIGITPQAVPE